MLGRIFPDPFIPVLLAVVLLAAVLPVSGAALPLAMALSTIAIVLLFFLHGLRLPREDVRRALAHWRLNGAAFLFCFGVMPLAGFAASLAFAPLLPPVLALGLVYLGVLPSTVQSATTASNMAGGNVAASVIMAALLNLAGILLSPLLFSLLADARGEFVLTGAMLMRILGMLLLPFAAGQIMQPWLRPWALRRRALTVLMDRTAIAIAVYVALSGAVAAGLWAQLGADQLAALAAALALLLIIAFGGAWALGRVLHLPRADGISLFFAGAQKSVAVGAPMATILFPPAMAGTLLLPLISFHIIQLIISAWIAAHLGKMSAVAR